MLNQFETMVAQIRWDKNDVAEFIGEYLTEPKPHVYFNSSVRPLTHKTFVRALAKQGVSLDAKSRLLFTGKRFFINGEMVLASGPEGRVLKNLADHRTLPPQTNLTDGMIDLFYDWSVSGWLKIGS
jgi:50S ribosomal protein L16 3-hydroxylase